MERITGATIMRVSATLISRAHLPFIEIKCIIMLHLSVLCTFIGVVQVIFDPVSHIVISYVVTLILEMLKTQSPASNAIFET